MLFSQKHEIGVFLGTSNIIGDIGRTEYINPSPSRFGDSNIIPFATGIIYRLNLNPQQSLRFGLGFYRFGGSNKNATEDYRLNFPFEFRNSIFEASSVFEYNFSPINDEQESFFSPYIFGGIAGFSSGATKVEVSNYDNSQKNQETYTFADNTRVQYRYRNGNQIGFTLPFGVGLKYKFNWNWVISGEVGFRPSFSDNLDLGEITKEDFTFNGVTGKDADDIESKKNEIINKLSRNIGNPSNDDWCVFSGLTLTYTFGRPPCFCD